MSREIARGGMGAVYAAHDPVLDREVAIKVMHPGQDAGRFVVESKMTAQLPHPGVPPVYALGTLADGRPFLAMKLIEGRTLADELKVSGRTDLPRLLGAFEQICQTVGFAHSKGIIHRDLKPANVMVGAFGEVQVMDWGLARAVGSGQQSVSSEDNEGSVATRRGASAGDETQAGQVKGTPAYMAPEQARGEPVDARADVFALGGILAVTLTGKPPFLGDSVMDTVLMAAQAELTECFTQLDACGADAELVAVAKRCLAAEPADRYPNGEAVAAAVAAYRAGVEERLRKAERDRAVSAAEAREQRKQRKVQLALAAAVVLMVMGGGAFAWWQDHQRTDRKLAEQRADADRRATEARLEAEQRFKAEQARQGIDAGLKLATDLRKQYKFKQADAALAQAAELAKSGAPERLAEVEQARSDLAFVVQLDDIRYRKWVFIVESGGKGNFNTKIAPSEYREAFAARGLNLEAMERIEAAKQIAASAVKADLVAAVDDWALYEPEEGLRNRLLEIARRADPGPWTDRLRNPAMWNDTTAVEKLAADADPAGTSPAALSALAELMRRRGLNPAPLLATARATYPADFELAFVLGGLHLSMDGQQIGPYEAARALRPENVGVWINLGGALRAKGDADGAIVAYRGAIKYAPKDAVAHATLGYALGAKGDVEGAIAAYREAIKCAPNGAVWHSSLGLALRAKGDVEGAIAAHRQAIRCDPKLTTAHYQLGVSLSDKGDVDGALAAYREAIRCDPRYARAHTDLGIVLWAKGDVDGSLAAFREAIRCDPELARAYYNMGIALSRKGNVEGAIAAYREAIRCDPKYVTAHTDLGVVLKAKGDVDGALAAYREATKCDPRYARAHFNLGVALSDKGDADGALAAYREAIKCDPKFTAAHTNLGATYLQQKKYPEALGSAHAAIKADPRDATAHALLGATLSTTGDIPGARAAFIEATRLDKRWASYLAKLPPVPIAPPPREVNRP